ncbi:MAG: ATP-dependent 6-phosphofructokinase [Pirellulales bacterium]|nr:ATP-dependent 6-phosphofructokinase [Pirellulales bacterium]
MSQQSEPDRFRITALGPCTHPSPLGMSTVSGDGVGDYVPDDARVLYDIVHRLGEPVNCDLSFEKAGPRQHLFFQPDKTKAAVVTCGGLCPGLNNVIRSLYYDLCSNYGISELVGIRYGYQGLNPKIGRPPITLSGPFVDEIIHFGGTVLGTSRGPQEPAMMVEFLRRERIDILFCIGGDGTQRGAHAIAEEIARQELPIAVVGIPKTIDNDIQYVNRTFGFITALSEAEKVIDGAHAEAKAAPNGVGLVKLMGREAGFIAAGAALANGQVDFALIPEVPFRMEGEDGLLAKLRRRLHRADHAVIVVAEGAGQDLLADCPDARDASGNRRLGDIGLFLKDQIQACFGAREVPVNVKYFDPSYHIRSVPANTADSILCSELARHAAHAAMAGKTDLLIGLWHNCFIHVPLAVSTGAVKRIDPEGELWIAVLASTRQESW